MLEVKQEAQLSLGEPTILLGNMQFFEGWEIGTTNMENIFLLGVHDCAIG